MKYTEEEKQAIKECESLIKQEYYGDMYFYERRSIQIVLNLLEKQKKQIEINELNNENKRIKYFSNNLFIDDYISKELIREKIKEIEDSLKEDCIALHEFQRLAKIDVLKEILGE